MEKILQKAGDVWFTAGTKSGNREKKEIWQANDGIGPGVTLRYGILSRYYTSSISFLPSHFFPV